MVQDIVTNWINELLHAHNSSKLSDLTSEILHEEMKEAQGAYSNSKIAEDVLGMYCNSLYLTYLQEALDDKEGNSK